MEQENLALKKKLTFLIEYLQMTISKMKESNEKEVYKGWLQSLLELDAICKGRNRY